MKEAYLKARGEGFKLPMDSFDVAFLPGEMPRLLETRFDHVDARRWCFYELDLGPFYLAALATEVAPELELKLWDWNGWQVNERRPHKSAPGTFERSDGCSGSWIANTRPSADQSRHK